MAKDPYRYFRVEARDLLEQLGRAALDLERGGEKPLAVSRLLRLAHTLKGAARVVRQPGIADHAHAIEEMLTPLRESSATPGKELVDALFSRLDRIGEGVDALAADSLDAAGFSTPTARPAVSRDAPHVVRADVEDVDLLLVGVGQVHARIAELRRELQDAARACGLAQSLAERLAPRRSPLPGALHDASHGLAEELHTLLARTQRSLARSADRAERDLRGVREAAQQLRLMPASILFTPLERAARDDARLLGKEVVFAAHGGDVRLDPAVLEAMQGALLQLVRNAIAHGIEPVQQRLRAGKPAHGRIEVHAVRRGRNCVFACVDDGAGVDVRAVREAASRKGWLPAAAGEPDAQALLQLLVRGGLSTAAEVTEVAGRGIGLDLVHDAVVRLGGNVSVQTESGKGTRFELTMPMSMASFDALMLEAAGRVVAIPLSAVRTTLRRDAGEIARTAEGSSLMHEGSALPFAALARLLGEPAAPQAAGATTIVIVAGAQSSAAIGIDRLLGTAHVVQHALPGLAPAAALIAGASLDADGTPRIVLDPDGLVARVAEGGMQLHDVAAAPSRERDRVLVIDDSLTSRMLEKSILESAGYLVHTASSAEEGLEQARRERYALFLVDVEMPGMDGFSFVERTGSDPSLRGVPAILVTSRCAPEDRQRGARAGARGYIVKSEFAQADFLRQVRELVAAP